MENLFKKSLLLMLIILSVEGYSQFTYLGGRISYQNVRFDNSSVSGYEEDHSRINNGVINLDFTHRPLKYFGVGFTTRIPIIKGYRYGYNFQNQDYVSGGGIFSDGEFSTLAEGNFSHLVKLKSSLTVYGRLYATTESNIYFDIRYTSEKYEETYEYTRQNSILPIKNTSIVKPHTLSGMGLALGYMPVVNDHLYYKYQFSVDFLSGGSNYTLDVISSYNGDIIYVPSKIDNTALVYEVSFGLGYAF